MGRKSNKLLVLFRCDVIWIGRKYFIARIDDCENPEEEAKFCLYDFPEGHIDLGTSFLWKIYKDRSEFILQERRWSKKEIDSAKKYAKKMMKEFGWK